MSNHNNIEELMSKQDLAVVKKCGNEMYEATGGKITVDSTDRPALKTLSSALLEREGKAEDKARS